MLRHKKSNVYYREIYDSFNAHKTAIPLAARFCIIPPMYEVRQLLWKLRQTRLGEWLIQKPFIRKMFKKQ